MSRAHADEPARSARSTPTGPATTGASIEGLRRLAEDDLRAASVTRLRALADLGHRRATPPAPRVFWLCDVFGEPGAEETPVHDATRPAGRTTSRTRGRSRSSSAPGSRRWRVVEGCLDRWTPAIARASAVRRDGRPADRGPHPPVDPACGMINHEAYHLGEINLALGANGREPIDPWPGAEWEIDGPALAPRGLSPSRRSGVAVAGHLHVRLAAAASWTELRPSVGRCDTSASPPSR